MGVAIRRRQRANQIYVDTVEPGIWRLELANGGHGMDLNFGALTHQACAGPVSDVLVHAGPDVLGGDEALCGAYARMGQTMKVVEDRSAELWGHIGL